MLGAGLALILTTTAGAFGDAGHRVIGRIAEMHLTNTRALQEVRGIFRPGESLADASVWADTIRSATYEDEDTPRFRLAHPAHETYHYTNVPFQKDRYDPALPGAHFTDIVQMTRECIRVLRGSSQAFTRREALRLLAHFAGDIHQPLHVGNAFVSAEGPLRFVVPEGPVRWRSSLGGNALRYGPDGNFNLHSYWDSHAVNLVMRKEDPAAYAARLVKELGVPASWRTPRRPGGLAGSLGDRRAAARQGSTRGHQRDGVSSSPGGGADRASVADRATGRVRRASAAARPRAAGERRLPPGRHAAGDLALRAAFLSRQTVTRAITGRYRW